MVDNTENNWKDFSAACIGYFIMMIIYALIGVDLIILSKEFTFMEKEDCAPPVDYIDYLYPTDDKQPPYFTKYDCKLDQPTNATTSNRSCKKCKLSSSAKISKTDMSTAWPYNYLHDSTANLSIGEQVQHWYKYTFANILYAGYYYNRLVMKSGLECLCSVPDLLLILIGPIIIKLLIFVATFCGFITSILSLLGIIQIDSESGTKPTILLNIGIFTIIIFCLAMAFYFDNLIIKIIFFIPPILFTGLFGLLLGFMPIFLMFSSIFSLLYPLSFDKGKSAFEKLADNKDILSLLYAAGVCIVATINLNITVASTMWVIWAILVLMKIITYF